MQKDILLITPPFTQLNTPYPATPYIKGFLNTKGISSHQVDLGIEVILELFSANVLAQIFEYGESSMQSDNAMRIFSLRKRYIQTVEPVIKFLQGKNNTLARQICTSNFLPQASRFAQLDDMEWAFGNMGMQDHAKHLATLYLEDLSDFIIECVDDNFGFSRYAERLGRSANAFDEMHNALQQAPSFIDELTLHLLEEKIKLSNPLLVCFSVPFPGNLYSAFKCAQFIRQYYPHVKVAMGGGFANTELRSVNDARVFDFFHFITLDDGELPIELLVDHVKNPTSDIALKRTFICDAGQVIYNNYSTRADYKQKDVGTPDYSDLFLDEYISVIEIANPMHSLWSDGRWNKLTMAHGCYWGKCTFCDISLDYIKIYEPVAARMLVDRMEQLMEQTGETGFHFVDEAAPPALMREVALEIIRRELVVTWWTNIRFEKSFTFDLCQLLKASGCVAVSGGLEVASGRLLKLIDKGVSVEQVARVTRNFTDAGVMVHAYLMYGYPTQTVQETVDSLEMVRQLFMLGIIQSGFWHQFALTAHSPVGLSPEEFGVVPDVKEITFANNDVQFKDSTGIDHSKFSFGLKKSLFNYMHGMCFDYPLQDWFDFKIPNTTIAEDYITNCIEFEEFPEPKANAKVVWTGGEAEIVLTGKKKRGEELVLFSIHTNKDTAEVKMAKREAEWLASLLYSMSPANDKLMTFGVFQKLYEEAFDHDFEEFWYSPAIDSLKENGLLIL